MSNVLELRLATLRRVSRVFISIAATLLLLYPSIFSAVSALSQEDKDSLYNDTVWYKTDSGITSCLPSDAVLGSLPSAVPEPYNSLFTKAAAALKTNPSYVTSLFITEHHNTWPNPNGPWASSPHGAQGPFQFMQGTWDGYKTDGDGDGKADDPQNLTDAAYTAAHMLSKNGVGVNAPLGDLNKPFVKGSFTRFSAEYNAGPSAIDKLTSGNQNAPLSVLKGFSNDETFEYVNNAYEVVHSGFTKGYVNPHWGDGKGSFINETGNQTTITKTKSSSKPTVVIDPGHAGIDSTEIDSASGLKIAENTGATGELQDMWDTAQIIKSKLEKDGYNVVLTKTKASDQAGLLTKARLASQAHAAIGVSLHYTPGTFGVPNSSFGVTPQKVGEDRVNKDHSGQKVIFNNADIAQKSQQYAQAIAEERNKTGDKTNIVEIQFNQTYVLASGNIPIISLFSNTPWVYNETGYSGFDEQKYATGITNGIEKALGSSGATSSTSSTDNCPSSIVAGNIVQTALNFAWDTPGHKKNESDAKPEYVSAKKEFNPDAVGDDEYSDCGVFVATVIRASNVDREYPGRNTKLQMDYVSKHPDKYQVFPPNTITQISQLQEGDIFISVNHTYIYTGQTGINANGHNAVSASLHGHVPEVTGTLFADSKGVKFEVVRIK